MTLTVFFIGCSSVSGLYFGILNNLNKQNYKFEIESYINTISNLYIISYLNN